jgi:hypothetical protein
MFELELHLNDALAIYRSLGFEPFLLRQAGWRHYMTPALAAIFASDCSEIKYEARLAVQETATEFGWYSVSQQVLTVFETLEMRETAFHELFHSLQARYLGPAAMADDDLAYFTEATAVLSEALSHIPPLLDVTRANRPLRTVDETLLAPYTTSNANAGALPYHAQDFWAFAANRFGRPFHTFTLDFLTAGGVAARDVDAVFQKAPYTSSFVEMYHEWALDQIFDLSTCSFVDAAVKERVDMGVVVIRDDGASGLPYRDIGENLERLNVIIEFGGIVEFVIGLDTAPSDITAGFDAASGTGLYSPSVIVCCSEKGRNPLTFTLQLVDELQFVSQEKSVDITVDYGDCP